MRKLRQSVDFGSNDKISELDESEELKEDKYSPPSMTSKKRGGSKSRGVLTIAEVVIEDSRSGASSPSPSDGVCVCVYIFCAVLFMLGIKTFRYIFL